MIEIEDKDDNYMQFSKIECRNVSIQMHFNEGQMDFNKG